MIVSVATALLALLALSLPVGVVLFLLGFGVDVFYSAFPLMRGLGQVVWSASDSFLLIAIPFFVLLGEILVRAGIAERTYKALDAWFSWLPGGLIHANIGTATMFSATSGSSVATAMGFAPHPIGDPHEDILWHYILKEAALIPGGNSGRMLGNVGSTIVAEVFGGLLAGDPGGYVRNAPDWTPAAEPAITALMPGGTTENGGDWEVADLIRASGAPVNDTDVANTIATGRN